MIGVYYFHSATNTSQWTDPRLDLKPSGTPTTTSSISPSPSPSSASSPSPSSASAYISRSESLPTETRRAPPPIRSQQSPKPPPPRPILPVPGMIKVGAPPPLINRALSNPEAVLTTPPVLNASSMRPQSDRLGSRVS